MNRITLEITNSEFESWDRTALAAGLTIKKWVAKTANEGAGAQPAPPLDPASDIDATEAQRLERDIPQLTNFLKDWEELNMVDRASRLAGDPSMRDFCRRAVMEAVKKQLADA